MMTPRGQRALRQLLSPGEVSVDPEVLKEHSKDKWFASHMPDAVAFPKSAASVSKLLAHANRHRIPVTARGAGHGYVGGCVPVKGGVVLSLARMDQIREINAQDFVAVVQAGVVTEKLQTAVEKEGLYYPPDPASRGESFIGGNIATNAGGPRCLKYGVTRDYVLGLEAVLANGDIVHVGGRTHKNRTGFDFSRLLTGSEGMLAVITEATLKLIPMPPYRACLAVGFGGMKDAIASLHAIFKAGFLPCALEVADAFTLAAAFKRTKSHRLQGCRAHLIVELDGQKRSVRLEIRDVEKIVNRHRPLFVEKGLGASQCEAVWKIRREFSYALRDTGLTKLNEDVVVPRGHLQDLFNLAAQLQRRHGLPLACFGHAGDGNIHVNIMVDYAQPQAECRSQAALDELFRQVLSWGGAISGEHGIGIAKKAWWPLAASPEVRKLHRAIKNAMDPHGILNPGKFL